MADGEAPAVAAMVAALARDTGAGLVPKLTGEALTDARLGDIISVKNQESGKIIQAIVSGKGAARAR